MAVLVEQKITNLQSDPFFQIRNVRKISEHGHSGQAEVKHLNAEERSYVLRSTLGLKHKRH